MCLVLAAKVAGLWAGRLAVLPRSAFVEQNHLASENVHRSRRRRRASANADAARMTSLLWNYASNQRL